MTFRTLVLASALIAGTASFAFAQSGGDAGNTGSRNSGMTPSQNNQSGVTDPKGAAPMGSMSGSADRMNENTSSNAKMVQCPSGMGRASGSNSTGPTGAEMGECRKL